MTNNNTTANANTNVTETTKEGKVMSNKKIMENALDNYFKRVADTKEWFHQQTILLSMIIAVVMTYFNYFARKGTDSYGPMPAYKVVQVAIAALLNKDNGLMKKVLLDGDVATKYNNIKKAENSNNVRELENSFYLYSQSLHQLFNTSYGAVSDNEAMRKASNDIIHQLTKEGYLKIVLTVRTNKGAAKKTFEELDVVTNSVTGKCNLVYKNTTNPVIFKSIRNKNGVNPDYVRIGLTDKAWSLFFNGNKANIATVLGNIPNNNGDQVNKIFDNINRKFTGLLSVRKFLVSEKQGFVNNTAENTETN